MCWISVKIASHWSANIAKIFVNCGYHLRYGNNLPSVQWLSRVRLFATHELQHARLPCHHQFLKFTQTHVHRVGDTIQPSHPLSPPSPPALPASGSFPVSSTLRMRWPKYWSFSFSLSPSNEHPGLISFGMDWLFPFSDANVLELVAVQLANAKNPWIVHVNIKRANFMYVVRKEAIPNVPPQNVSLWQEY